MINANVSFRNVFFLLSKKSSFLLMGTGLLSINKLSFYSTILLYHSIMNGVATFNRHNLELNLWLTGAGLFSI